MIVAAAVVAVVIDALPLFVCCRLKPRVVTSPPTRTLTVGGTELVNFASCPLLGTAADPRVLKRATRTIDEYAVGTCGPRGFYGTLDLHLELERKVGGAEMGKKGGKKKKKKKKKNSRQH
jgi:hypothetical protein